MTPRTIKDLCTFYEITQTRLARRFDIPLRTVQDWYAGRRTPPAYVAMMLEELLLRDHLEAQRKATRSDPEATQSDPK